MYKTLRLVERRLASWHEVRNLRADRGSVSGHANKLALAVCQQSPYLSQKQQQDTCLPPVPGPAHQPVALADLTHVTHDQSPSHRSVDAGHSRRGNELRSPEGFSTSKQADSGNRSSTSATVIAALCPREQCCSACLLAGKRWLRRRSAGRGLAKSSC